LSRPSLRTTREEPDVDAPVYTDTDPDAPYLVVPVYSCADPLAPDDVESDVASSMLPELEDTPAPVTTVTLPPALESVVVPAAINTLPPVPESVAPDNSDSDPAVPAVAEPVPRST